MLGEIQDVEGNGLVGTGSATQATAVNTSGQQITTTNIVQGYELGGDVATGNWLDGESSPRLYSYTLTGAGGEGFVIYIDALTALGEMAYRMGDFADAERFLERAVALRVPVLQHAWIKTTGNLVGESFPADVADFEI